MQFPTFGLKDLSSSVQMIMLGFIALKMVNKLIGVVCLMKTMWQNFHEIFISRPIVVEAHHCHSLTQPQLKQTSVGSAKVGV